MALREKKNLIDKVINTIKKYNLIESGDCLVLGVSGGPDSISMLDILLKIKQNKQIQFDFVVAHVNHMIREEAKEDELRRLTALEAATNIENTTHTDNSTGEEKTVTIPAGFAVSQVEGENTIEDGLVIIDQNGNEFVWVPVKVNQNIEIEVTSNSNLSKVTINGEEQEVNGKTFIFF